jgi:hypothetical protein
VPACRQPLGEHHGGHCVNHPAEGSEVTGGWDTQVSRLSPGQWPLAGARAPQAVSVCRTPSCHSNLESRHAGGGLVRYGRTADRAISCRETRSHERRQQHGAGSIAAIRALPRQERVTMGSPTTRWSR